MSNDRSISSLRSEIMKAACRAFASHGYAGTSVRTVALDAGTTKPMIYYYFGSKSGLFRAVHEDLDARAAAAVAVVTETYHSATDRLAALLEARLAERKADPAVVLFLAR